MKTGKAYSYPTNTKLSARQVKKYRAALEKSTGVVLSSMRRSAADVVVSAKRGWNG